MSSDKYHIFHKESQKMKYINEYNSEFSQDVQLFNNNKQFFILKQTLTVITTNKQTHNNTNK